MDIYFFMRGMIFLVAGLGVVIFPQPVFTMQSRAVGYLVDTLHLGIFRSMKDTRAEKVMRTNRMMGIVFMVISAGLFFVSMT